MERFARLRSFWTSVLLAVLGLIASDAGALTFTVTSAADSGAGTLRQAIITANTTAVADVIRFDIPGAGVHTINLVTALPTISEPLTIDGYSQPGATPNTLAEASDAVLLIRLDGAGVVTPTFGLAVCAPNTLIRGLSITRFNQRGIAFGTDAATVTCAVGAANGSAVRGNFIGLRPDGSAAGNLRGIFSDGSVIQVGGTLPADRNVISSSAITGVAFTNVGASGSSALGNLIGWDPTATVSRGNQRGVSLGGTLNGSTIGSASAPNWIANNTTGMDASGGTRASTLFANHIGPNNGIGIDLSVSASPDGVTPNDNNDADSGGNDLQNFPVLSTVTRSATGLTVSGGLDRDGSAVTTYVIALYASSACDATGNGEGERFLGSFNFVSNSAGDESFSSVILNTQQAIPVGSRITATATNQTTGNTSEFSSCSNLDSAATTFVVTSTADTAGVSCGATCTLRQAITAANAHAGADRIHFDIPGSAVQVISPATPLPTITQTLIVDGYTQPGATVNTSAAASNAAIRIQVVGSALASGSRILAVCGTDSQVRGVALTGLPVGAAISFGVTGSGTACSGGSADNSKLLGSFIGVAPNGNAAPNPNATGVDAFDSKVQIGSENIADRNVVSSSSQGIQLNISGCSGSKVLGNLVGWNPAGLIPRGNTNSGVHVFSSVSDAQIGSAAAPNRIGNNLNGIRVNSASSKARIFANDVGPNANLGIDLIAIGGAPDGVTANDANDADSGGNTLQNFPLLGTLSFDAGQLAVVGSLDVPTATSNAVYTIAIYQSAACDSSGNGEGEWFLGSRNVVLSGNLAANEQFVVLMPMVFDGVLTATATDPLGNTSEFSACVLLPSDTIFENGFD